MKFTFNISEILVIVTILSFAIIGFIFSIKQLLPVTKQYYQVNKGLTSRATQTKKRIFLAEQKKIIQALYILFIGTFLTIIFCFYTIINTVIFTYYGNF